MADHEPMTDVACGVPELSAELRDALALLRDRSEDAEFRTLVDDVLAGRCSLLDASGTKAFGEMVFAPMAREFDERLGQMTEDERRALAAQHRSDSATRCAELHRRGAGPTQGAPCVGCPGICAASGTNLPC